MPISVGTKQHGKCTCPPSTTSLVQRTYHYCIAARAWSLSYNGIWNRQKPSLLGPRLLTINRVDTIGSYAFDALPSLNIPCHKPLVTLHQQQLGSKLIKLLNSMDHRHSPALVQAFHSLQSLNHHLALSYAVHGSSIWADPVGIDEMVNPTVRQFLCLCIPSEALHEDSLTWSCLRSAALLYLAELRRRSGISPVITTVQVCKLKFGVMAIEKHRFLHPTLLLWLLTIGALESITESDKSYFNCRLSCLLQELQITKLSDFRVFLNEILWFDALFDMRIKLSSLCPPD